MVDIPKWLKDYIDSGPGGTGSDILSGLSSDVSAAAQEYINRGLRGNDSGPLTAAGTAPTSTQKLVDEATAAAKRYNVPAPVVLGVISHESGFNPNPKTGNGGGIGQFIRSTAAQYGTTQEELTNNPSKAVDLVAKYLADNAAPYAGDPDQWLKATAAYFIGPGNVKTAVSTGGSNWLKVADDTAKQYGQGSVTDYLGSVNNKATSMGRPAFDGREALNLSGSYNGATSSTTSSGHPTSDQGTIRNATDINFPDPNADRYWQHDSKTGSWSNDKTTYLADLDAVIKARDALQKTKLDALGPYSQYIDDSITEMQQQIAAGNLSVTKANDLVTARINAYKTAADVYNSKAFTSGAPVGAKYIPGTEPGNPNGYTPIPINGGVVTNPLQDAADAVSYSDKTLGAVNIPTVPDYRGQRQALFAGALGIDTSKPPTAPPPPPAPVPSNISLESHLSGTINSTDPNSLFKQALAQAQTTGPSLEQHLSGVQQ